jgi:aminoglycoside phosphotransferase (APT) family kinase protein
LGEYLRGRIPAADGPLAIEPLPGGQSNPTFRLRQGERSYVLRKQPEGELLPSAHAVDREYRVMTALARTDVPVPRTYCYCDDRSVIGTPFFVMEFLDGRHFWDPALPELDAPQRAALWDDINSVMARLHRVDYAAIGLADYGRAGNYFERQIGRWTKHTAHPRRRRSHRWTGSWTGCHAMSSTTTRRRSCTATSGSTTSSSIPARRR